MREQHPPPAKRRGRSHRSTPAWAPRHPGCRGQGSHCPRGSSRRSRWRAHRSGASNRARVTPREMGARREPGRGGDRGFSCERGRSHLPASPAARRGLRRVPHLPLTPPGLPAGRRGRRDQAIQFSVTEPIGRATTPSRAPTSPGDVEPCALADRRSSAWSSGVRRPAGPAFLATMRAESPARRSSTTCRRAAGPRVVHHPAGDSCDVAARGRIGQIPSAVIPSSSIPSPESTAHAVALGSLCSPSGRSRWQRRGSSSVARADGISRISMRRDSSCSAGGAKRSRRSRMEGLATWTRPSRSPRPSGGGRSAPSNPVGVSKSGH